MNRKLFNQLHLTFGLMLCIVAVVLTIKWYDGRLLLILFLALWSNNISQGAGKL